MKKLLMVIFFVVLVISVVSPVFAISLTSLTLEKSTNKGEWTNAPGGIWSTNLGDPLTQLGVMKNGTFVNIPVNGINLGEISVDLTPGLNTFELYGTSKYGAGEYYGLSLFFNHHATPPDMAVYNSNGSSGIFSVTTKGTKISGSANGGIFPDIAPGSSIFLAQDGSKVELIGFNVLYDNSNKDLVSWANIGPDGFADTHATLQLNYSPVPEPSTMFLITSGLFCLGRFRKKL